MAKVLVVDDEPDIELLVKQKFRKQTESGAFELLFALNGSQALELVKNDPSIAVVVSDVNMPEMDGLTLLEKLKELNPETKTIIVSAYGDTKTLRGAMNKGAFDFVTKPIDFDELGNAIERTLILYKAPTSHLYAYQLALAAKFPARIDLNYPHTESLVLWDAYLLQPGKLEIIGVSCLPSSIPMDIAVSIAHGLLKSAPGISFDELDQELSEIQPNLKAHVLRGHYHLESQIFSYKSNGPFTALHIKTQGATRLTPSVTALLDLGDVITIEYEGSESHISFARVDGYKD